MSEEVTVPEWAKELPEALQSAPFMKGSETVEMFVDHLQNAANTMGNSIRIPGPDAAPEKMGEFQDRVMEKIPGLMKVPTEGDDLAGMFQKLGMPAEAEGYKLPEGVNIEGEALGKLKAEAHAINMTQAQFEANVKSMWDASQQQAQAAETKSAEEQAVLREEWGPGYDARIADIKNLLGSVGADAEVAEAIASGAMGAGLQRVMNSLVELASEEGQTTFQQGSGEARKTKAEIMQEITEINQELLGGSSGREMDATNPRYSFLIGKRQSLMQQAAQG